MKKKDKIVITGTMVANIVSVLSVIASVVLLILDENKKSSLIFLMFSLLWLSFNISNNRKNKR